MASAHSSRHMSVVLHATESSAQLGPRSPLHSVGPWRAVWGLEQGTDPQCVSLVEPSYA